MDAVERATAILKYIVSADKPVEMAEISKQLSIHKVSVWRTLSALENVQWVTKDLDTGLYTPGREMLLLAVKLLSNINLRSVSKPYMEELNKSTQETVMLCLKSGTERIFIDSLESPQLVRFVVNLGVPIPLGYGAAGKAILAFTDDSEINKYFEDLLDSKHPTVADLSNDIKRLKDEIKEIRKKGYAISVAEWVPEVVAVGAPIFNNNSHTVIGSICVCGPFTRFTKEMAISHGPLVADVANKISQALL